METLIEALARLYPDSSKTTLKSWIEEGRVFMGDKQAKRGDQQVAGEIEVRRKSLPRVGTLKVYFADRDLIVIDKPAGLLSVKAAFEGEKTAHGLIKDAYNPKKVFVIHRLDQETSGVMMFGLSERSFEPLKEQFKVHSVDRVYTAVLEGEFEGEGTWVSRLEEDEHYRVHVVEKGGEEAITHYRTIKTGKGYTLVEFELETGKKNQIRVQSAHNGHPIVGDEKYGAKGNPIRRLALHATHLGFQHPGLNKRLSFTSPPPPVFEKLIKKGANLNKK